MYAKNLEESKYQFLIQKRAGLKNLNDKNAFVEDSSTIDDIFENIEDYKKRRKRKVLTVFDDMISHVMSNKKAQQVLKDLFLKDLLIIKILLIFTEIVQKNLIISCLLILHSRLLIKNLKIILLIFYNKSKFLIIKLGQIKLSMI